MALEFFVRLAHGIFFDFIAARKQLFMIYDESDEKMPSPRRVYKSRFASRLSTSETEWRFHKKDTDSLFCREADSHHEIQGSNLI